MDRCRYGVCDSSGTFMEIPVKLKLSKGSDGILRCQMGVPADRIHIECVRSCRHCDMFAPFSTRVKEFFLRILWMTYDDLRKIRYWCYGKIQQIKKGEGSEVETTISQYSYSFEVCLAEEIDTPKQPQSIRMVMVELLKEER